MTPKGRLMIIGGNDAETFHGVDQEIPKTQFPASEVFRLLSNQKNERIEIITASPEATESTVAKYSAALQQEGYTNFGFIHLKNTREDYHPRILAAKTVFFIDESADLCETLKNSSLTKLIYKKYLLEEEFTIAGINAGGMFITGLFLDEKEIHPGLGFINNCIIDTQFRHGTRFKSLVKAVVSHRECLGIGLNEGMALVIEKGYKARCIGNSSMIVVNARNVRRKKPRKGFSVYAKNLKGHILTAGSTLNLISGELIKEMPFDYNLNFTNRNTRQ
ncbi:Type 1 glutamine amidotransferase-like domain-containing protein [uncultured Chryseobacterium sp.]|uniref:Type 1 glutamine amidotransferase-like domain-containing protein n=1 Tax=uncultured Chryseobacterium sp. TaxID=259322 RepID=UPI0025DDD32C|nr:Type 1 glutamine amidotransferase-like domain-containing protein [uncultured Chryseobacterium sp.]